MAEIRLTPKSPLGGMDKTIGQTRLREVDDVAMVSVAIPLGEDAAVEKAVQSKFSLSMPTATRATASKGARAIKSAADQVILFFDEADALKARELAAQLEGIAYTTIQTDAWVICEVSGAGSLAALERLCPIDLHPDAFPVGAYARTVMEHLGAAILRTGDDSYWLMSASSSAGSFAHAIEQSMRYTA